jgi:hypothetical protein
MADFNGEDANGTRRVKAYWQRRRVRECVM